MATPRKPVRSAPPAPPSAEPVNRPDVKPAEPVNTPDVTDGSAGLGTVSPPSAQPPGATAQPISAGVDGGTEVHTDVPGGLHAETGAQGHADANVHCR